MPEVIEALSKLLDNCQTIMNQRYAALNKQPKPFTLTTPNYAEFKIAYDLAKMLIETLEAQQKLKQNKKFLDSNNSVARTTNDIVIKIQLNRVNKELTNVEAAIKEAQNTLKITYSKPKIFKPASTEGDKLITDLVSYVVDQTNNFTQRERQLINETAIGFLPDRGAVVDTLKQTMGTQILLANIEFAKNQKNPITKLNALDTAIRGNERYKGIYETNYNQEVADSITIIKEEINKINNQANLQPIDKLTAIMGYIYGSGSITGIKNNVHIEKILNDELISNIMKPLEQEAITQINNNTLPVEIDELARLEQLSKIYQNNKVVTQAIVNLKKTTTNSLITKINDLNKTADIVDVLQKLNLYLKGNLNYPDDNIKAALKTLKELHKGKFTENVLSIKDTIVIADPYQKLSSINMLIKFMGDEKLSTNQVVIDTQKAILLQVIDKIEKNIDKSSLETLEQIQDLIQLAKKLGLSIETIQKLNDINSKVENNFVKNLQIQSLNMLASVNPDEFYQTSALADKQKRDKIPTVGPCIDFSLNLSYNLFKYMLSPENPTEVAYRMSQIIRMVNQFREAGNFYMFLALNTIFDNIAFTKLSDIIATLPQKDRDLLVQFSVLGDINNNYKNLRAAQNDSKNKSSYVPTLNLILKDIAPLEDGFRGQFPNASNEELKILVQNYIRDNLVLPFRSFQTNRASDTQTKQSTPVTLDEAATIRALDTKSAQLKMQATLLKGTEQLSNIADHKDTPSLILDAKSFTESIPTMNVDDALADLSKRITAANNVLLIEDNARNAHHRMAQEQANMAKEDTVKGANKVEPPKPYQSKLAPGEAKRIKLISDISQLQKEMLIAANSGNKESVEKKWKTLLSKSFRLYEGASQETINNLNSQLNYFQAANKAYYDLAVKTLEQKLQAAPVPLQQKAAAAPASVENIPAATDLQQAAVAPVQLAPPPAQESVVSHVQKVIAVDGKSAEQESIAASSGVAAVEVAPPSAQQAMDTAALKPTTSDSEATPVVEQSPVTGIQAVQSREPIDLNQSADIKLEVISAPGSTVAQSTPTVVEAADAKNVVPTQIELNKLFEQKLDPQAISTMNIDVCLADLKRRIMVADEILNINEDKKRTNLNLPKDQQLQLLNPDEVSDIKLIKSLLEIHEVRLSAAKEGNEELFKIYTRQLNIYENRLNEKAKNNDPIFIDFQKANKAYSDLATNALDAPARREKAINDIRTELRTKIEGIQKQLHGKTYLPKDKQHEISSQLQEIRVQLQPYLNDAKSPLHNTAQNIHSQIGLYSNHLKKLSKGNWVNTLAKLLDKILHYVGFDIRTYDQRQRGVGGSDKKIADIVGSPPATKENAGTESPVINLTTDKGTLNPSSNVDDLAAARGHVKARASQYIEKGKAPASNQALNQPTSSASNTSQNRHS